MATDISNFVGAIPRFLGSPKIPDTHLRIFILTGIQTELPEPSIYNILRRVVTAATLNLGVVWSNLRYDIVTIESSLHASPLMKYGRQ